MHIALVFDDLVTGGITRIGANYAKILLKLGHEITVINLQASKCEGETEFPKDCEIIHASMPLIAVPDFYIPIIRKWAWGKYIYSLVYLLSKICLLIFRAFHLHRNSFDLAIAFSGHMRDLTYVSYGFIKAPKKLSWVHGCVYDFLFMSYTFKNLYLKIKNLCVLSEQNQKKALHFCDIPEKSLNIQKIYNPIVARPTITQINHVEELRDMYGDFLLMIGRFDIDKDQKTVLYALKYLEENSILKPRLLFVGDGPTRSQCEQLAAELGLSDHVFFMGTRNDVDDFYTAAHLTIHSSPSEGLPTVLLESMRCGTPVVSTNSLPGVPEILKDGEYGLICPIGDSISMANAIKELYENKSLYDHFVHVGRNRVKDFSFEKIGTRLNQILASLD